MLTQLQITKTKAGQKAKRLTDGDGLYLRVEPSNARGWRFDYRFGGKQKCISFGPYPKVTMAEARGRRDDARKLLRDGIDPSAARQQQKAEQRIGAAAAVTFHDVVKEWQRDIAGDLKPRTKVKHAELVASFIVGSIGHLPIADVTAPVVLPLLQSIVRRGTIDRAHAVKALIGQVLRYGVATNRCERDCTSDLSDALPAVKTTHYAGVTAPADIAKLMRAIHADSGASPICAIALKLLPLVFMRPGELRTGEWTEIDWKERLWRVPGFKMKKERPHLVPLAKQSIALLKELKTITGTSRYLFPQLRDFKRPMSEGTLNSALARLGYPPDVQVPHGFRTTASTRLNEMGFDGDHIEVQLAHVQGGVRGVYNQAKYLEQRTEMMQFWANYLDDLRLNH